MRPGQRSIAHPPKGRRLDALIDEQSKAFRGDLIELNAMMRLRRLVLNAGLAGPDKQAASTVLNESQCLLVDIDTRQRLFRRPIAFLAHLVRPRRLAISTPNAITTMPMRQAANAHDMASTQDLFLSRT